MKYSYTLVILLVLPYFLVAQSKHDFRPCGNTEGRSDWLRTYQKQPHLYEKGADSTILYIPLTIHNVATDVGTGYFKGRALLDALCTLNADFEASNMRFFIEGDVNHIANTAYNIHETVLDGAAMMFANNVPNTLNCYIVSDPASNCGYNLPYAGIALAKNCANPSDHTWAHEVGHAFKLPHPFLGWEGGVSHDDSVEHDYNNPAPEKVLLNYTYFKDTLILDTLIIDTVWVELAERSNCHFAGDGFCDTEADYLSSRWQCTGDATSAVQQTDPKGERFTSDGTLIMSYSNDNCAARFTNEQTAAMRANLFDEKPELLYNQSSAPPIGDEPVTVISPFEGEITPPDASYFEWNAVPNATHYVFELSPILTFSALQIDTIVSTTSLEIGGLLNERRYYWRVRPFNSHTFCTDFSARFSFETGTVSSTHDWLDEEVRIYPNLLHSNDILSIEFGERVPENLLVNVLSIDGKLVHHQTFTAARNELQVALPSLAKGVYYVHLESALGAKVERIVVY